MKTTTQIKFGYETQKNDDGSPVVAWWFETIGDNNGEPIAGGYANTEADARNDANIWLAMNPEYTAPASVLHR